MNRIEVEDAALQVLRFFVGMMPVERSEDAVVIIGYILLVALDADRDKIK